MLAIKKRKAFWREIQMVHIFRFYIYVSLNPKITNNFLLNNQPAYRANLTFVCFQDREFVEMEVPFNGAPKRPGSPSPLTSPAHSTASRGGLLQSCCGRCYPQRYQVRGRRILASTTSISEAGAPPDVQQPAPATSQAHKALLQPAGGAASSSGDDDPAQVPNVAFSVPGEIAHESYRSRATGGSSSPYNETRVWKRVISASRDYSPNNSDDPF